MASITPMLQAQLINHIKDLEKAKILTMEDPTAVAKNMHAVLTFAVINQITNPKTTASDADLSIRTALSMLGISDAKAKKLTEAKLPF
jgi:hypothetical protein